MSAFGYCFYQLEVVVLFGAWVELLEGGDPLIFKNI